MLYPPPVQLPPRVSHKTLTGNLPPLIWPRRKGQSPFPGSTFDSASSYYITDPVSLSVLLGEAHTFPGLVWQLPGYLDSSLGSGSRGGHHLASTNGALIPTLVLPGCHVLGLFSIIPFGHATNTGVQ